MIKDHSNFRERARSSVFTFTQYTALVHDSKLFSNVGTNGNVTAMDSKTGQQKKTVVGK